MPATDAMELRLLRNLQRRTVNTPVPPVARGLSRAGEHAATWLLVCTVGALLDRRRRVDWTAAGGAVFVAHAGAVVVKRLFRRHRPRGHGVEAWGTTPSELSFPSAHASSTTAAAVALAPLVGGWATAPVAIAMGLSRLVLGVHYPSDVVTGAVWGALCGAAGRRISRRSGARP